MAKARKPETHLVESQASWNLRSSCVDAMLTQDGGHLGPVIFRTKAGPIQPFSVAPWANEALPSTDARVLAMLRGDFFCAPFGNNTTSYRGEKHPPHGEPASARWRLGSLGPTDRGAALVATLRTKVRAGLVTKRIELRDSETNLYCRHVLQGFSGPMNLGHHAMLKFPERPGAGLLSLSPFQRGQVLPSVFEHPETRGYSALKPGAGFRSLSSVPDIFGGRADLSSYPARAGYEDLVMVCAARPASQAPSVAWTSVAFPSEGYLWIAFKDPRVLASTVLWHSNGGRHYPPWSGRHRGVLGLEEVTSYFHYGLAESARPNPVSKAGIPTVVRLSPTRRLSVNYVMCVAAIPRRFDRVAGVEFRPGSVRVTAESGARVDHAVDLTFLHQGPS